MTISENTFMIKNNKSTAELQIVDIYEQILRGKDYEPTITIQEIPSMGRSSRIQENRTGRRHDFLKRSVHRTSDFNITNDGARLNVS